MSFQAYLDHIEAKTDKSPDDFKCLAAEKDYTEYGRLCAGIKAGEIVAWLKEDFEPGHGHAMAIFALLKSSKSDIAK